MVRGFSPERVFLLKVKSLGRGFVVYTKMVSLGKGIGDAVLVCKLFRYVFVVVCFRGGTGMHSPHIGSAILALCMYVYIYIIYAE